MLAIHIEMRVCPVWLFPLIVTTVLLCVDLTGKCEKLGYKDCEKTYKGQSCSWDEGECKTKGQYRPHVARARICDVTVLVSSFPLIMPTAYARPAATKPKCPPNMINPFACKCGTEKTTTDAGCPKVQCKSCEYKSLRIDDCHVHSRAP